MSKEYFVYRDGKEDFSAYEEVVAMKYAQDSARNEPGVIFHVMQRLAEFFNPDNIHD